MADPKIPLSHRDLLVAPIPVALATVGAPSRTLTQGAANAREP
jgi:hypothetical protein